MTPHDRDPGIRRNITPQPGMGPAFEDTHHIRNTQEVLP